MDVERIIDSTLARFIGTKHERDVKKISPIVGAVGALEAEMKNLSDAGIDERTLALRAEVQNRLEGAQRDDPDYRQRLDSALEPVVAAAFALVREAGRRTLGMRHF